MRYIARKSMKYNPLFLLRFAGESRKKSRKSTRKIPTLHQILTHLHKPAALQPLRRKRRAGAGGFGGGGVADFSRASLRRKDLQHGDISLICIKFARDCQKWLYNAFLDCYNMVKSKGIFVETASYRLWHLSCGFESRGIPNVDALAKKM